MEKNNLIENNISERETQKYENNWRCDQSEAKQKIINITSLTINFSGAIFSESKRNEVI